MIGQQSKLRVGNKKSKLVLFFAALVFAFSVIGSSIPAHAYYSPNEALAPEQEQRPWAYLLMKCMDTFNFKPAISDDNINKREVFTDQTGNEYSVGHEAFADGGEVGCHSSEFQLDKALSYFGMTYQELINTIFTPPTNSGGAWRIIPGAGDTLYKSFVATAETRKYAATDIVGPKERQRRVLLTLGECLVPLQNGEISSSKITLGDIDYKPRTDDSFFSNSAVDDVSVGYDMTGDFDQGREKCTDLVDEAIANNYTDNTTTQIGGGAAGGAAGAATVQTCESLNPGLGYVTCGVLRLVLDALDGFIGIFVGVLEIEFSVEQRDVLKSIWNGFRSIANVGFAIAFMVVIYSAATGNALKAYDVKRLLPKLAIAAIGVQVSLDVTLWLIQLSNDVGNGIADLILSPLPGNASGNTSVATAIIRGSPLGTSGGLSEFAAEGLLTTFTVLLLIAAAVFSLAGLAIMTVVFLLRNIAIIVLSVMSPLWAVSTVMPFLDGFSSQYKKRYQQMLMLFPIASAFIASGRLVGAVLLETQTGNANTLEALANRSIGTAATFAPFFMAGQMVQMAGSSFNFVRKGFDNTKSRFRKSDIGQRLGKSTKAKAWDTTSKIGTYSGNNRFRRGASQIGRRATGSKTTSMAAARALGAKAKLEEDDTKAAGALLQSQLSGVRSKVLSNGGSEQDADNAANSFLNDQLFSTDEHGGISGLKKLSTPQLRAAAKHLTDNSNFDGINTLMAGLEGSGSSQNLSAAESIKKDNIQTWSKKAPHVFKGSIGSLQGMSANGIADLHGSSVEYMIRDASSIAQDAAHPENANARAALENFYTNFEQAAGDKNLRSGIGAGTIKIVRNSPAAGLSPDAASSRNNIINNLTKPNNTFR